jgi:hypothetical protein
MTNNVKQTSVDWLIQQLQKTRHYQRVINEANESCSSVIDVIKQAKAMEKEQRGYSKKDVLKAGELGEINHIDTKHIVSYLDEAKQHNETYGGNK